MVMASLTLSNTCHPGLKGMSHNFTLKIQNYGPGTALFDRVLQGAQYSKECENLKFNFGHNQGGLDLNLSPKQYQHSNGYTGYF